VTKTDQTRLVWGVGFCIALFLWFGTQHDSSEQPAKQSAEKPAEKFVLIPATFDEIAAVIKACGKPTKDHPQELQAGASSEGRALVYRNYNTELWFYRGPRSQQWMLMNSFVANGDDSLSVEEANARMPCMHGNLQDHMRAPQNEEERMAVERAKTVEENVGERTKSFR